MGGLGTINKKCHAKRGRRGVRKVGHYGIITRVEVRDLRGRRVKNVQISVKSFMNGPLGVLIA